MSEHITPQQCTEFRANSNKDFMEKINNVEKTLIRIEGKLFGHIDIEEKTSAIMKYFIWLWLPIIIALIWVMWWNLNDKINDIHDTIKTHDSEITELKIEAQRNEEEDKQYHKYIKWTEK